MTSSRCVLFLCGGLMAVTGESAPPAVYLDEPTTNFHIPTVDGKAICFANLLEIQLKSAPYLEDVLI